MLAKSEQVVDGTIRMNRLIYSTDIYNFLGICINPQGYCIATTYLDSENKTRYLTHLKSGEIILSHIKKDLSEIIEQSFLPEDKFINLIKKTIECETSQYVIDTVKPFMKNLKFGIDKLGMVQIEHVFYVISDMLSEELPGDINTKTQVGQTYSIKFESPLANPIKSFCYTASLINEGRLILESDLNTNIMKKIKNELSNIRSQEDIKNLSPELIAINYAIGEIEYRNLVQNLESPLTAMRLKKLTEGWSAFARGVAELYRS